MSPGERGRHPTEAALERLLRESAELRRRSEQLMAEVERLRNEVAANGTGQTAPERRQNPRLKGK